MDPNLPLDTPRIAGSVRSEPEIQRDVQETVETLKVGMTENAEEEMQQYFGSNIAMSTLYALGYFSIGAAVFFVVNIGYIYISFIDPDVYEQWLPFANVLMITYFILLCSKPFVKNDMLNNTMSGARWLLIAGGVLMLFFVFPVIGADWVQMGMKFMLIIVTLVLMYPAGIQAVAVWRELFPLIRDAVRERMKRVFSPAPKEQKRSHIVSSANSNSDGVKGSEPVDSTISG